MTFVQVVTLVVFVLAGALMGFKAWRTDGPIPQPAVVEGPEVVPDPATLAPVVDK